MPNFFRTIAAAISGPTRTRNVRKTNRRIGLNVENLGERIVMSASPIHAIAAHPALLHRLPFPLPHRVPNLQGYTFYLNSTNGKPSHTLIIKTESYNWFGSASFTGTWQGDGPNGKPVSGTLAFAANSTTVVNVNFSWTNGNGGQNSFSGSATPVHNRISIYSGAYYLTGNVTSSTGGGPGMVSGFGYPPRPVVTVNF